MTADRERAHALLDTYLNSLPEWETSKPDHCEPAVKTFNELVAYIAGELLAVRAGDVRHSLDFIETEISTAEEALARGKLPFDIAKLRDDPTEIVLIRFVLTRFFEDHAALFPQDLARFVSQSLHQANFGEECALSKPFRARGSSATGKATIRRKAITYRVYYTAAYNDVSLGAACDALTTANRQIDQKTIEKWRGRYPGLIPFANSARTDGASDRAAGASKTFRYRPARDLDRVDRFHPT